MKNSIIASYDDEKGAARIWLSSKAKLARERSKRTSKTITLLTTLMGFVALT
jgi:hypothetical protein